MQSVTARPWGARNWTVLKVMGIVMKKMVLLATALAMVSGSALAADMRVKAVKAPPPAAFDPWDIAFGSSITSDYVFRGITQSNHKPSVSAYFEPRYNVTKDLQLYVGLAGASISFPNRAAAEIDIYGGIRPTFGTFAFDFGVWGYLYPGGTCHYGAATDTARACRSAPNARPMLLINGNVIKKNVSFYEGLRQGQLHRQRHVRDRRQRILLAELPEPRRLGQLRVDHRQVHRAEHHVRQPAASACTSPASSAGSGLEPPIRSTARLHQSGFAGRSRTASTTPTTTPGTSASASPTRCSRWISATPTPTCRRVIATPSPAISQPAATSLQHRHLHHADQSDRRRLQLVRRGRHRQALG